MFFLSEGARMVSAQFDLVVIGAGVVGCAVARQAALAGSTVLVVDYAERECAGISSRNSEVIHSGIYYPAGSLKASLCVRGRELLYDYARKREIAHRKTGKLIVACSPIEVSKLTELAHKAEVNNAGPVRLIDKAEAERLEPLLQCEAALHVEETGIISAHEYCRALRVDAENSGAQFAFSTVLLEAQHKKGCWSLNTDQILREECSQSGGPPVQGKGDRFAVTAGAVINCAGLYSDWVSGLVREASTFEHVFVKGEYFSLASRWRNKVQRLIYPVPEANLKGLGIHSTIDLSGALKLGPNTVDIPRAEDFSVDASHRELFFAAASRYLRGLTREDLEPGYAGIRPKRAPLGATHDFVITEDAPRFVSCGGIESPGLTASLAIAEEALRLLG
ncbi:MAG: NAD(P)/FAD-dependent oxidoreductase [Proteobacteria bacterium]|nr:NAD(P)/FAD-dependent oxidoreductase [Pseudomonadota bacterium]